MSDFWNRLFAQHLFDSRGLHLFSVHHRASPTMAFAYAMTTKEFILDLNISELFDWSNLDLSDRLPSKQEDRLRLGGKTFLGCICKAFCVRRAV